MKFISLAATTLLVLAMPIAAAALTTEEMLSRANARGVCGPGKVGVSAAVDTKDAGQLRVNCAESNATGMDPLAGAAGGAAALGATLIAIALLGGGSSNSTSTTGTTNN